MTGRQLTALLQELDITEDYHGDCVGADTEFHNLIRQLFPKARIIDHPGFPESDLAGPITRAMKSDPF
jgi:hypothetical protein